MSLAIFSLHISSLAKAAFLRASRLSAAQELQVCRAVGAKWERKNNKRVLLQHCYSTQVLKNRCIASQHTLLKQETQLFSRNKKILHKSVLSLSARLEGNKDVSLDDEASLALTAPTCLCSSCCYLPSPCEVLPSRWLLDAETPSESPVSVLPSAHFAARNLSWRFPLSWCTFAFLLLCRCDLLNNRLGEKEDPRFC